MMLSNVILLTKDVTGTASVSPREVLLSRSLIPQLEITIHSLEACSFHVIGFCLYNILQMFLRRSWMPAINGECLE